MGVVFGTVVEGIAFGMGFVIISMALGGGLVDGLGGLVGVVFGRTNMRLVGGPTLFRSVRTP